MEQQPYRPPFLEHMKIRRQDFFPLIIPLLRNTIGDEKTEYLIVKTNSHWRRP